MPGTIAAGPVAAGLYRPACACPPEDTTAAPPALARLLMLLFRVDCWGLL
jgi:hypothetical protein